MALPKKEESLLQNSSFISYQNLANYHLYLLKQQSKCEAFYWKGAGVFFLFILLFFSLKHYNLVSFPFIGIVLCGIGILLLLAQNMRMDFEYGIQADCCVEKGVGLEKDQELLPSIFKIFRDNKLVTYRGNLISRLVPMGLIGFITSYVSVILALKVVLWLAFSVAIFSTILLLIGIGFYIRTARRIFRDPLA